MNDDVQKKTRDELEREVERLRERLRHAEQDRTEAFDLVARMREHIESYGETREQWIDAFAMQQDETGTYKFTTAPGDLWERYDELLGSYNKLIGEWNKFVPDYNRVILKRDRGRPLHASEAQVERVRALRKGGASLNGIVATTNLTKSTVRTIVSKAEGTDAATKRRKGLVRRESNRLRAAAFRTRKRSAEALGKQITDAVKEGAALVAEAKGALARNKW
jgi:hypothetical protein